MIDNQEKTVTVFDSDGQPSSIASALELLASLPGYLEEIEKTIFDMTHTKEEIEWQEKFDRDPESVSLFDKVKRAPDSAFRDAIYKVSGMIYRLSGRCSGHIGEEIEKIAAAVRAKKNRLVIVDNYIAKPAYLFDPDGNLVGEATNDTAIQNALAQIKEKQLEGYYWLFNDGRDKILVSKDGACDHYPKGFCDSFGNETVKLM